MYIYIFIVKPSITNVFIYILFFYSQITQHVLFVLAPRSLPCIECPVYRHNAIVVTRLFILFSSAVQSYLKNKALLYLTSVFSHNLNFTSGATHTRKIPNSLDYVGAL